MSALTQMYIDTVVRHLPEGKRDDIADEIRTTVEDMVEGRCADLGIDEDRSASTDPGLEGTIEREVLEELGDPVALSREYAGGRQQLIGPRVYPLFVWSLRWILPAVGFIALLSSLVVTASTTESVDLGTLIGATTGTVITALLTAFAVITILGTVADRLPPEASTGTRTRRWSVDELRAVDPAGGRIRFDAIAGLVILALLAMVPLIPTTLLYVGHLNDGGMFINPDLGAGWLVGYWALLALLAIVEVVRLVRARAGTTLLIVGGCLDVVMAVFLTVALTTQAVYDPALTSDSGMSLQFQQLLTVGAVWVIVVWDQIVTWRSIRSATPPSP